MKFGEKLDKLAGERSRAELSRQAGLPQNAISDYVNKGYIPRLDTAAALAKVLGASLDWLADDSQGWPPPARVSPAILSDEDLMTEVARRYRLHMLQVRGMMERLKAGKWQEIAEAVLAIPIGEPLPAGARSIINGIKFLAPSLSLGHVMYDPKAHADARHATMPGSNEPVEKLDWNVIANEWGQWIEQNPLMDLVLTYDNWVANSANDPAKRGPFEEERREVLREIKAGGPWKAATRARRGERGIPVNATEEMKGDTR